MMGSSNCMMDCVVRRHSMSQLSMSRVTGLDDLRGRPHLSRWFAPGVSATRSFLGSDDIRGEGSAIADPVAVSELSVFPLRQRPTEPELGAARGKGGAAITPLNLVSSEDGILLVLLAVWLSNKLLSWTNRSRRCINQA